MAVITSTKLLASIRSEAASNGVPTPQNQNPPRAWPFPTLSKPSWFVRTEAIKCSERKNQTARSPCVVCRGSGRVDCHDCHGRGRTNQSHLTMLPKGEWPKWCRRCGGSGLGYCPRCLGTGEYRDIVGFRFMMRDTDNEGLDKGRQRLSADVLLNGNQSDSVCEGES